MSIHTLSALASSRGIKHVVVEAKTAKKFSDIESFAKSLESKDSGLADYAKSYHKWVKGGRKGSAPKAKTDDYKSLKYVRIVVSQLP